MDRYPFAEAGWRVSAADFSGGDVTRTVAGWHRYIRAGRLFMSFLMLSIRQSADQPGREGGKPMENRHGTAMGSPAGGIIS
ncbi:hypothetical protein C3920_07800 [Novacetimonas pomaceti]|uniref:Uncharacterized protein n=1 Tax=Novacetimonas pomaceti TaxID=2021998 RepID=A0ABX5P491_9PROT|nr:hypothetical protein C3920_07800 [Novacetimonas pomaceti]